MSSRRIVRLPLRLAASASLNVSPAVALLMADQRLEPLLDRFPSLSRDDIAATFKRVTHELIVVLH